MTILAVFRSRTECLDYTGRLYRYGVAATTIAAPKEAKIGCGLCAKFESAVFPRAKAVLALGKYSSFKGFYKTDYRYGRLSFSPV